jgi:ATP-dependent DNA helicase RecG
MNFIMNIIEKGIEGRRLEFKQELPENEKIAKTVIAFSNGSGGNLIIGIEDKTRKIIGISEKILTESEEKITNIIYDTCYPSIRPEVIIYNIDSKYLINVRIYPGSQPPYYLKAKGRDKGTYIRIGSTNRLADKVYIARLDRIRQNISFDEEIVYLEDSELELEDFIRCYRKATGKSIDNENLKTLGLIRIERDQIFPTNAGILLQSKKHREIVFKYAHINCARFKGNNMDVILDQYTADEPIFLQPEAVMKFVMRNIAKSSEIGLVYRENRWEYPLNAIREAVINAVIHRDYSITGSDIKVAIFDDRLEITSPGSLPAVFDILNIYDNPSEIRNKILAPIFKELDLIEQWGNGMKKIKREMENYPELKLIIKEISDSVLVQFIKTEQAGAQSGAQSGAQLGAQSGAQSGSNDSSQVISIKKYDEKKIMIVKMLTKENLKSSEITEILKLKSKSGVYRNHIKPLLTDGIIETVSEETKTHSSTKKYQLTEEGRKLAKKLEENNE